MQEAAEGAMHVPAPASTAVLMTHRESGWQPGPTVSSHLAPSGAAAAHLPAAPPSGMSQIAAFAHAVV
jgi:hypothetical protein